jgi:hypothetical protein
MKRSRRSVYRLHDVMIAVAFTAIGLVWVQSELGPIRQLSGRIPGWSYQPLFPISRSPFFHSIRSVAATSLYVLTGIASPWAIYLLYRSKRPGRTWRFGRVRRPGAVASLAATVVLSFELLHATLLPWRGPERFIVRYEAEDHEVWIHQITLARGNPLATPDPFFLMLLGMPRHAGLAVAGAWLTLFRAGAWRPESTWVDRAGRVLGVFWLVAGFHFLLFPM